MDYSWNFRAVWLYREALAKGTIVTVELTLITILLGTVFGVVLALGRLSTYRLVRWPSIGVIELFRALPLLVLLVWIYYCLPILTGWRITAFTTAVLGMSINLAAFAAETFRAGIEGVLPGYLEAARSLGMRKGQTMWRIVLPQATRQMLPPLVGLYITMLKLSSLASVVSVTELLHAGNDVITRTYRPLEVYSMIALIYVLLVLPGIYVSQKLETRSLFERKEQTALSTLGR